MNNHNKNKAEISQSFIDKLNTPQKSSKNNDSSISENPTINNAFLVDDDELSMKSLQTILYENKGYYSFEERDSIDSFETSSEAKIPSCMDITHNIFPNLDQTYEISENKRYFKDPNISGSKQILLTNEKSCSRNDHSQRQKRHFILGKKSYFTYFDTPEKENNSPFKENYKNTAEKENFVRLYDLHKLKTDANEQNFSYNKQDSYFPGNSENSEPPSYNCFENIQNFSEAVSETSDSFDCSLASITFPPNQEFCGNETGSFSEEGSLNSSSPNLKTNMSPISNHINDTYYEFPRNMQSRLEPIIECSYISCTSPAHNLNNNSSLQQTDDQRNNNDSQISGTHFENSIASPGQKMYRSTFTINLKKWNLTSHKTDESEVADCSLNSITFPPSKDYSDDSEKQFFTWNARDTGVSYNCKTALGTIIKGSTMNALTPVIGDSVMFKSPTKVKKTKIRQATTAESGKLSPWSKSQPTSKSGTSAKSDFFRTFTDKNRKVGSKHNWKISPSPRSHINKNSPKTHEKNGNVKIVKRQNNASPQSSPLISTTPIKPVSQLRAFFSRKTGNASSKNIKPENKPNRLRIPTIYEQPKNIPLIVITQPSPRIEKLI